MRKIKHFCFIVLLFSIFILTKRTEAAGALRHSGGREYPLSPEAGGDGILAGYAEQNSSSGVLERRRPEDGYVLQPAKAAWRIPADKSPASRHLYGDGGQGLFPDHRGAGLPLRGIRASDSENPADWPRKRRAGRPCRRSVSFLLTIPKLNFNKTCIFHLP